jgi:hypothetical protein
MRFAPPALGWRAAVALPSALAPSADVLRSAVLCAGQPPVRSRAHTAHACARMSIAALTACPTRQWLVHRCGPFPHRHRDWAQLRPHLRLDRSQPAHMYLRRTPRHICVGTPPTSAPGLGAAALGELRHAFSPLSEVDVVAASSPSGHLARLKAAAARLAERCPPHQPPCGRALALRCEWGRGEPSPGADVARGGPGPGAGPVQIVARPSPGADVCAVLARARASSEVDADSRLWARSWRSWVRGWSASSAAAAGTRGPVRVKLTAPRLD